MVNHVWKEGWEGDGSAGMPSCLHGGGRVGRGRRAWTVGMGMSKAAAYSRNPGVRMKENGECKLPSSDMC